MSTLATERKQTTLEKMVRKYSSDPKYQGRLSVDYKKHLLEILEKKYPRHQKVVMLEFDFRGHSFL